MSILSRVRDLRKNQTPSENILWQILRGRKLDGWKFVRQYPIKFIYDDQVRFFIADFYCHSARLVIELDGKIHEKQKEYDQFRTYLINQLGIQVLRIKNEELQDIAAVSAKVNDFCNKSRYKTIFPSLSLEFSSLGIIRCRQSKGGERQTGNYRHLSNWRGESKRQNRLTLSGTRSA